jgi:hypothetical protein
MVWIYGVPTAGTVMVCGGFGLEWWRLLSN